MKAVILAGGSGTRLWPLSTKEAPKQFQNLTSNKSMLEETIDRLDFLKSDDIYISINNEHADLVRKLLGRKILEKNIIIEPAVRDTAPCIGFAATIIANQHPEEVMCVIYADHLIKDKKEFQEKLKIAEQIAIEKNTLNIIEVQAKEPDTNYGYVKLEALDEKRSNTEIYLLNHFVEKPDLESAKKFVESGNYLWNTGMYVWKAKTLLDHYKNLKPEIYSSLMEIAKTIGTKNEKETISKIYPEIEKISIDYAIMEKVDPKEIRIIKANLGWSDIGNWEAIYNELAKYPGENIERGQTRLLDCKGCITYSDNNKVLAAIGLEDIVIIDTKDGILVCKKKDAKRIKEIL